MKQFITDDNIYYVQNAAGTTVLKIYLFDEKLDGLEQIHIETPQEVYNGPIEYLTFWSNAPEGEKKNG